MCLPKRTRTELIFWDNQSTDSNSEIIKSYDDPCIYFFYAPKHTILYEARNYVVKKSKREFLAFLEVDDWWEPNNFHSRSHSLRMKPLVWCVEIMRCSTRNQIGVSLNGQFRNQSGFIINELLVDYHERLLTILLLRSAYERLGGFDSRYHVIGDFDSSLRLAESWQIKTLNQIVAHYRMHGESESALPILRYV